MIDPRYRLGGAVLRSRRQDIHQSQLHDANKLRGILISLILLVVASIALEDVITDVAPRLVWFVTGGLGLGLILQFKRVQKLEWFSASVAYMIVFWMFHFGLIFAGALLLGFIDVAESWVQDWCYRPEALLASATSLLFLACFALGNLLVPSHEAKPNIIRRDSDPTGLIVAGWLMMGLGLLWIVVSLMRFGWRVFLLPYMEFYSIHNAFSMPVILIAYGLMLQLAGRRPLRSVFLTAVWVYLPLATFTMLAGARTAPLFSALVLMVVFYERGVRLPRWAMWLGAFGILTLIGIVREVRLQGWGDVFVNRDAVQLQGPLFGLTELGGSLRPVYATVDYMQTHEFFYGSTYLYPFVRQIQLLFGLERGTPSTDPRFIAQHINHLYGSIGYSTVAEAYANGGVIGVVLFALLWGYCLRVVERWATAPYGLAVLACVLIPMLINIRNSFIYVPAWMTFGMIVIAISRQFPVRGK